MTFDEAILNEHTYYLPDNSTSIKVVCINVCGLLSKLRCPDFEEICQAYDTVCLTESKLGSFDSFEIRIFDILHLINRKMLNGDHVELQSWLGLPFLNMLKFWKVVQKMCYCLLLIITCFMS